MTNPTLERAARALAALDEKSYRRLNMYGVHSERYLAQARAVLMAVRTLDQSSINAAIDAGYEASGFHDIFHFPTAIRTAIDEVLKDG